MTLLRSLINAVSPQALQSLSGALGETSDHTRQGLLDALPAMLSTIIGKASTTTGAASLLSMMNDRDVDNSLVDRFASGAQAPTSFIKSGDAIANSLLGPQMDQATNAIASHAGVSRNSAHSLLALAGPLALGGIAKAAPKGGFTPDGLMRFLRGERDDVFAMMPAGVPGLADVRRSAMVASIGAEEPTRVNWMPWIVSAGVAAVLAFMLSQFMAERNALTPTTAVPATPTLSQLTLPNGARLSVRVGSIAERLANFLGNTEAPPRTFAFQNLNFDTGDVVVTPESTATLDAIATILRAYPAAMVRLEGHTDTTGDRAANLRLSLDRANSIGNALVARGVERGRISTGGFGPDQPRASNTTEEGRAQNRRLELTVLKK
jgi:outer membrane protein OmpA-like peptidoglycan-associated protein